MASILNTKLTIPDVTQTIRRQNIAALYAELTQKKLTTITAGPGFGKTTLIAQIITNRKLKAVWYRLDPSDQDFVTFIRYLIIGMQRMVPGFGEEIQEILAVPDYQKPDPSDVLTVLINELDQKVTSNIYLVLDDYHTIHDSPEIKDAIEYLLEYLPDAIRLILISRSEPNLALSRLRARNLVLDIKKSDLVLSLSDTRTLFKTIFNLSIEDGHLERLSGRTEGWVSGLILFYNSIRGQTPREIEKSILQLKGAVFSDYLEENVFEHLPSEIKGFLIKTSVLPRLEAGFCDQLISIDSSDKILHELVNRHLFTFTYDRAGEWFSYHQLFRDFLLEKLVSQLDASTITTLHLNAGKLFEKREEYDEAISHYIKADAFDRACTLLKDVANDFLEKWRTQWLETSLSQIPPQYIKNDPQLQYIRAFLHEIRADFSKAISGYMSAYPGLRDDPMNKLSNPCLLAMGRTYIRLGQLKTAEEKLTALLEKDNLNLSIQIQALVQLTVALSQQGKINLAGQYIDKALSLLGDSGRQHLGMLGILYLSQSERYFDAGNFSSAIEYAEKAKSIFENTHYYRLLHLLLAYYYISRSYFNQGLFSEGLENAEKGLDLAQENSFHDQVSYGNLLLSAAHNLIGLERLTEATTMANRGLQLFEERGYILGQALAYTELHLASFCKGDWDEAEAYARSGLALMKNRDIPRLQCVLTLNLSQALLAKNQLDDAIHKIRDAKNILSDSKSIDCGIALLTALYHWKKGQKSDTLKHLTESLTIARSIGYEFRLVFYKRIIIPMLIDLYDQDVMKEYIEKIILMMGSYALDIIKTFIYTNPKTHRHSTENLYLKFYTSPLPGLAVRFFGPFTICIDDRKITSKDWASKKAEMLLKYLLYHRSRGFISKEECMELLWPEEDPQKTAKRFHVALAAVRKMLEPHLLPGMPSSYIKRKDDAYAIDIGKNGSVDLDEFSTELEIAQKEKRKENALPHYLRAESILTGDFLIEDQYVDWCIRERDIFNEKRLIVLKNIIDDLESKKEYVSCIRYATDYIRHDPCAENIYRKLMEYYAHEKNLPMIKKTFEKCKSNLMTHLECPVSDETEMLYQGLTSTLSDK